MDGGGWWLIVRIPRVSLRLSVRNLMRFPNGLRWSGLLYAPERISSRSCIVMHFVNTSFWWSLGSPLVSLLVVWIVRMSWGI